MRQRGWVKVYVTYLCYLACSLTRHYGGCALINKGGLLYNVLYWSEIK